MNVQRSVAKASRHGFSLIELLLAIFILGIGIISIAAVFPAGIIQQRRTQDDVIGPAVAEAAMATIRSHVDPSDFGTLEEFGLGNPYAANTDANQMGQAFPDSFISGDDWFTVPGDWAWMRPSMAVLEDVANAGSAPSYVGDIDIFSARKARASDLIGAQNYDSGSGNLWNDASVVTTTELQPFGDFPLLALNWNSENNPGAFLYGIPFNRSKYDFFGLGEDPLATITQEDRFWPAGTGFGLDVNDEPIPKPQYAWECMFRRHQGRIQVAIFVYRISASNVVGGYMATHDQLGVSSRPVLPARLDLHAIDSSVQDAQAGRLSTLTPMGADENGNDPILRADVPGTEEDTEPSTPANPLAMNPYLLGWQAPGQWFLDPYGRIHRVVQGRRSRMKGPVRLARPIPVQPQTSTNWNWLSQQVDPASPEAEGRSSDVRSIWFMPPSDARGVKLTPVYATVREL